MYATVYRTRERGVRLPTPSRPVAGKLYLSVRSDGSTKGLAARLMLEDKHDALAIPELLNARVLRISGNGIVISGTEVIARRGSNKSNADSYSQTWWCLIHTVAMAEAMDFLNPEDRPFGTLLRR